MRALRWWSSLSLLALAGCRVDVNIDGKPCPCVSDYECVNDVCVPRSGGSSGDCLVGVGSFRATWATPHTIRWEWEPSGKDEDFQAYRLYTDVDEAAIENGGPSVRIWTNADNPELGVFTLRRTDGEELVRHTVTDELEPNTLYHARLEIVDSAGCVARSENIAGKSTTDATPQYAFMKDDPVGDWGELLHGTTDCYAGAGCWSGTLDCGGAESCYRNLRRAGATFSLQQAGGKSMTAGSFTTAYVSFYLQTDASIQPWWGNIGWVFGADVGFIVEPYVFRVQSGYRRIEVPLSAFLGDHALGYADLELNLSGFFVGLDGPDGTRVWVDEVEVGW